MQLIQELLSTGIITIVFLSKEPIMFGFMNKIIIYPYKTSTLSVIYSFKNTLKLFFIIQTSSTWFNVNLILHPLNSVIQKLSCMKLSYLLLVRELVLIYWMVNILQSLMSLIQSQIHQLATKFWHRLSIVPGSRWNVLPPGTITRLTLTARQRLKPPLEYLAAANTAAIK